MAKAWFNVTITDINSDSRSIPEGLFDIKVRLQTDNEDKARHEVLVMLSKLGLSIDDFHYRVNIRRDKVSLRQQKLERLNNHIRYQIEHLERLNDYKKKLEEQGL